MARPSNTVAPLAVTIGEPAGIGVDALLAAWNRRNSHPLDALPPFVLICDPDHLKERAKQLGVDLGIKILNLDETNNRPVSGDALGVLPLKNRLTGTAGQPVSSDATGIVEAIRTAVDCTAEGKTRGIVTLPINKKSLYDAGFAYPGHTEFLGALADKLGQTSKPIKPVMMLAGPDLKAVPVTIHIPLRAVSEALTTEDIVETTLVTAGDLQSRFGIARPRVAISGLNPHAGENGALGDEDQSVIAPAIEILLSKGVDCIGPLPADTMFHKAAREQYDVAICMYHDQALIPAKALGFDETVNVTLGLPFVRTSPDHGTAFDIAGTGKANPASTIAALRLADQMTSKKDK